MEEESLLGAHFGVRAHKYSWCLGWFRVEGLGLGSGSFLCYVFLTVMLGWIFVFS